MSIKELSKRSVFHTDDYGISGIDSADAEIVVDDNGKRVFLHAMWVSEVANEISFETTHESTYDIYQKMFLPELDINELSDERDRIVKEGLDDEESAARYPVQREALIELVKAKLLENGIVFGEEEEED